ncbi:hypothetical protein CDIK_1299 [Cucumispora dikerogammari]|nr:hypothetical protein CDIK_1299 [Cucumispora dikerogammari]
MSYGQAIMDYKNKGDFIDYVLVFVESSTSLYFIWNVSTILSIGGCAYLVCLIFKKGVVEPFKARAESAVKTTSDEITPSPTNSVSDPSETCIGSFGKTEKEGSILRDGEACGV